MNITYKIADNKDIELLMSSRLEMLLEVFELENGYEYSEDFVSISRKFFLEGDQTTVLAFAESANDSSADSAGDKKVIGCASICYITVMPTPDHPTGQRAHLMNVYTSDEYRGQGIGFKMCSMLIDEAWNRGVTEISLDSTRAGHRLYEKLGFQDSKECMVISRG